MVGLPMLHMHWIVHHEHELADLLAGGGESPFLVHAMPWLCMFELLLCVYYCMGGTENLPILLIKWGGLPMEVNALYNLS